MASLSSVIPQVTSQVTAATTTPAASSSTTAATSTSVGGAVDKQTIAGNFTTFLTLLTTQLKNQNPLDPLDTNQFTAQLVQFAQVEQQMKQNDQLAMLVSIEKATQSTSALSFVGSTVAVDGQTAALTKGRAAWSFNAPKPASATMTIRSATGQTVYASSFTMNAGPQSFTWDGRDNKGVK